MSELPPRPELGRLMMTAGFVVVPTRFLESCRDRCGESFTLHPQPGRKLVLTSDPDAIRRVFTGDPELFRAGEGNQVLAPILGPSSTLLLDGDEHMRHRRLLLPPFHGERMRTYRTMMEEVAERHVARWPRDRGFPVLPSTQEITLEIIVRAVFGARTEAEVARFGPPLRAVLDRFSSRRQLLALVLASGRTGPRSPWARFLRARAEADALVRAEIRRRRAAPDEERDDIMSLLLAAHDESGEPLTEDELRDELMTLLVAGHETTATALAWTLERVTKHRPVLDRLLDEPGADSPYLLATIRETLRLRPVIPAVVRRLAAPFPLGPWTLPPGVDIAPSIYLLHRRADLYPEPDAFRPERFLGRTPPTYEWIPFGGGVRRCLGASFAMLEMQVVLAAALAASPRPARRRPEATTRRAITFAPSRGGRIAIA